MEILVSSEETSNPPRCPCRNRSVGRRARGWTYQSWSRGQQNTKTSHNNSKPNESFKSFESSGSDNNAQPTRRHLAAESALYCRIFTEGLFGIRPTGLHSFVATPHLPHNWDRMKLADIHAFGSVFDLVVSRAGDRFRIETVRGGKAVDTQVVVPGESATIRLAQ